MTQPPEDPHPDSDAYNEGRDFERQRCLKIVQRLRERGESDLRSVRDAIMHPEWDDDDEDD